MGSEKASPHHVESPSSASLRCPLGVIRTEQVQLGPRFAAEAVRCLGLQGRASSEEATAALGKGSVVFGVVRGKDVRIMVTKVVLLFPSDSPVEYVPFK